MARRQWRFHFTDGETRPSQWGEGEEPKPFCGADTWSVRDCVSDESKADCPACCALLAKRKLTAPGAPNLKLEKDELQPYRFAYKALLDDEHVGWIVYEGAYGKAVWKVVNLRVSDKDDSLIVRGYELSPPSEERSYGGGKTYWTDPKPYSYRSKEDALLSIPQWVEQGKLKSVANTLADHKLTKERAQRRMQDFARRQQDEAAAHLEMLEGLASIQTRATTPELRLTNSESVALAQAIERLRKDRNE